MKLKQIVNVSGSFLSFKEFKEYVSDYFVNYKEYKIDRRSTYFKEIKYSYSNLEKSYEQYLKLY
jgi:hypothetical protein